MIGYDLNGHYLDDPDVRMSVQADTPFKLGWTVRYSPVKSLSGGDRKQSKGAKEARPFKLSVMFYAGSDGQLDSRISSWFALLDQENLVLGRTVDGVRQVADVVMVSAPDLMEYNAGSSAKAQAILTLSSVYWRDPEPTVVEIPVGSSNLTDLADSSGDINDAKVLIPGAASPLTAFSITDDNSGSGFSWASPPVTIGDFLSSERIYSVGVKGFVRDPATGSIWTVRIVGSPVIEIKLNVYTTSGTSNEFTVASGVSSTRARIAIFGTSLYIMSASNVYRWETSPPALIGTYTTSNAIDIAVDSAGNYYVVDNSANLVRKYSASGVAGTTWSTTGSPTHIAIDSANNVYVSDVTNSLIRRYSSTGTPGPTWATRSGESVVALTGDPDGGVWVAYNNDVEKLSNAGVLVKRFGSIGVGDGQFSDIRDIKIGASKDLLVMDVASSKGRLQKFDGDGVFNGIGAGQWLLYEPRIGVGKIVTEESFDAAGDLIAGFSTVPFKGKKLSLRSAPNPGDLFDSRLLPVTVTQTGGDTAMLQARKANL